jgi:Ca2+-binding RTX toxin-like protein
MEERVKTRITILIGLVALAASAIPAVAHHANSIRGTKGDDTLTGTAGADRINALAGNDTVNAGAGDDKVRGGKGNDVLNGEDGNDKLKGNKGTDQLNGGAGNDRIDGRGDGRTADTITCGDGTDVVKADAKDSVASDCEVVKRTGKGHGKKNKGHENQGKAKGKGHDRAPGQYELPA